MGQFISESSKHLLVGSLAVFNKGKASLLPLNELRTHASVRRAPTQICESAWLEIFDFNQKTVVQQARESSCACVKQCHTYDQTVRNITRYCA